MSPPTRQPVDSRSGLSLSRPGMACSSCSLAFSVPTRHRFVAAPGHLRGQRVLYSTRQDRLAAGHRYARDRGRGLAEDVGSNPAPVPPACLSTVCVGRAAGAGIVVAGPPSRLTARRGFRPFSFLLPRVDGHTRPGFLPGQQQGARAPRREQRPSRHSRDQSVWWPSGIRPAAPGSFSEAPVFLFRKAARNRNTVET